MPTGTLLFEEVLRAAERGVRVRLLLDDLNTAGTDPTLALLASHPNLELRLYNPFVGRGSRGLGYLGDFTRLNHRMHNKSFTVDDVVSVVGGRNIADEYFEIGEASLVDVDVVAVGDAVRQVSAEFDLFWNSASAYPARIDHRRRDARAARRAGAARAAIAEDPQSAKYADAIANTKACRGRARRHGAPRGGPPPSLVSDDPAKTLSTEDQKELLLLPKLQAAFGRPEVTRPDLAVFRARRSGDRSAVRVGQTRRAGARADQFPRVHRREVGPVRLRQAPRGVAARRRAQLLELKPDAGSIERRAGRSAAARKPGCTPRPTRSMAGRSSSARSASTRARPS